MEPQPASGNSFIKSEPRIEASASKNELSQSNDAGKETNDLNEVSPSATDEGTCNPWAEVKCTFCKKSGLHFDDSRLLECLHTACMACINSRLNPVLENRKGIVDILVYPSKYDIQLILIIVPYGYRVGIARMQCVSRYIQLADGESFPD
jgi:hypothetical protein